MPSSDTTTAARLARQPRSLFVDTGTDHVARANAPEDKVRSHRVVNGCRVRFAGPDAQVPRDRRHALGLRADWDRFKVSPDAEVLFMAAEGTFAGAGRSGLGTKARSLTRFCAFGTEALR